MVGPTQASGRSVVVPDKLREESGTIRELLTTRVNSNQSPPRRRRWANPLPWTILLLASRSFHKVKSGLLARLFNAPGLYLGQGSKVFGADCIVFGRNFYVHGHLWLEAVNQYRGQQFEPSIQIGNNVSFSDGVHITCIQSITLGDGVLLGSKVYISDHNHGIYKGVDQSSPSELPGHRQLGGGGPVTIGQNVWIGDNVVILGPLVIGAGAIVAANAVVTEDVPAQTIVGGIPAKPIKRFDDSTGTWISTKTL